MSTFSGKMKEYANISIDRFDGINLQSTVYFLSHCHTDHMVGLSSKDFHDRLKKNAPVIKLYCSQISKSLLINDPTYSHLKPFIFILPIDEATSVEVPIKSSDDVKREIKSNEENRVFNHVTVTLIPAGHCPGSVMFLFEGKEKTVLYTGDFRFSIGSVQKMTSLHCGQDVKKIESLYIDTTFCSPQSLHIATRKQSSVGLIKLTKNWISRSKNHVVYLKCPAQFGYEYLFVELHKSLNIKIHVDKVKFMKYVGVLEITDAVTLDGSTQIHACYSRFNNQNRTDLPCGFVGNGLIHVLQVKISTMWFSNHLTINDVVVGDVDSGFCRVNFSTHSSLSEICDVVSYLKPVNIYANVVPNNTTENEIIEILMDFCEGISVKMSPKRKRECSLLGSLSRNQKSESSQESNLMFDVDVFSPIRKRRCESSQSQSESQETETGTVVSSQSPKWVFQCSSDSEEVTPIRGVCKPPEVVNLVDSDATPDSFTPDVNSSPVIKIENDQKMKVKRNLTFES